MVPLHVVSLVEIVIFLLAVLLHGRQVEWTARLDFLWQMQVSIRKILASKFPVIEDYFETYYYFQAKEEKKDMDSLQTSNKRILFNLLPAHVAMHFLDNQFKNNMVMLRLYWLLMTATSFSLR